jgi:molybdopterin-guanine dinucleotide biosynthesis protein A
MTFVSSTAWSRSSWFRQSVALPDVIVLAGGNAHRMGGIDKPSQQVGGVALLDHVLLATSSAARTVVVGPARSTARPVIWRREDPIGGGPVAALAAGLPAITADVVVLLAADLPFLTAACVDLLASNAPAVMHDDRTQWLCGAWPTAALREALCGIDVDGARLGDVLGSLEPALLTWPGADLPWLDCDTVEDLQRAREIA